MSKADDAFANFAADAHFDFHGETITISTDGANERSVTAIVDRQPPAVPTGGGNVRKPNLTITVEDHATRGILASAHNAGKSYVKVATTRGGPAERLSLHGKPASQDAGMLTFEL